MDRSNQLGRGKSLVNLSPRDHQAFPEFKEEISLEPELRNGTESVITISRYWIDELVAKVNIPVYLPLRSPVRVSHPVTVHEWIPNSNNTAEPGCGVPATLERMHHSPFLFG